MLQSNMYATTITTTYLLFNIENDFYFNDDDSAYQTMTLKWIY